MQRSLPSLLCLSACLLGCGDDDSGQQTTLSTSDGETVGDGDGDPGDGDPGDGDPGDGDGDPGDGDRDGDA